MRTSDTVDRLIRSTLAEIERLMSAAFEAAGGKPVPGSALDQLGLADGVEIVDEYLQHGEPGIALDHVIYMIEEPELPISEQTYTTIEAAGRKLGLEASTWERIRHCVPAEERPTRP